MEVLTVITIVSTDLTPTPLFSNSTNLFSNIQVFYPLALAASLFSTEGVLPFTPTLASFTSVLVILTVLLGATLVVCSNWTLLFQPMANYLMDILTLRKPGIDDTSGLEELPTREAPTSSIIMKRSFFPRGLRNSVFRTQGDLEEGTKPGGSETRMISCPT